jgi:hypothetical protein
MLEGGVLFMGKKPNPENEISYLTLHGDIFGEPEICY